MSVPPDERGGEIGFVAEATQYVLTLEGLPAARVGDVIVRKDGARALIKALADDRVTALALDQAIPRAGDEYHYLPSENVLSLGDHLFGRVITPLGEPVDNGEPLPPGNTPLALDVEAAGIEARAAIKEQLSTGITLVDTLLPIAKGQRQLLFGPVKGGKTDFLTDIVLNQVHSGMVCIYSLIGKSLSELERVGSAILGEGLGKNIVIAALSDQSAPMISIAPPVALLVADYFKRLGQDVLVVLDDLDLHAKYLREIALLENRLPGRESYPGDLFYEHARVLERAGQFSKNEGGGSITVLPVIETDPSASLGIVSTNLMACTDGHLAFAAALASEGLYPAIADDQSITRIGRNVQSLLQRQLSMQLRLLLANARRQRQYAQFGTSVGKEIAAVLQQGEVIEALMRQESGHRVPIAVQVPLLALALTPFFAGRDGAFAHKNRRVLADTLSTSPAFSSLLAKTATDTPLEEYLPLLSAAVPSLESVCQS